MYRRRRPQREKVAFGFDCFLDVVANVIGVIVRLILVAWVGARAYSTAMEGKKAPTGAIVEEAKAGVSKPLPAEADHPLAKDIFAAQKSLDEARAQLLSHLKHLEKTRATSLDAKVATEARRKEQVALIARARDTAGTAAKDKDSLHLTAGAVERLRERSRELAQEIDKLEKAPPRTKLLRYHTPVSRVVEGEELMFECRDGRVSYIDVPAFLHEIKTSINDAKIGEIAKAGTYTDATSAIGAFRLRYTFAAEHSVLNAGNVRIFLAQWVVEPLAATRGENETQALQEGSDFRRLTDRIDPNHTAVTFWVYPDSFALFRALRDRLYESGVEVAGRPLPLEHPIGASIHGTKSRGQ